MQPVTLKRFGGSDFRANPAYTLVSFDALPPEQQRLLDRLRKGANFFGILLPREQSGLGIKAVDRDIALLFLTLQQPGKVPDYIKAQLGERYSQTIAEFVLDGVLAIEREGAFVSGPEAATLIYEEQPLPIVQGRVARLSLEAVQYAQVLELDDLSALSTHLYFYNRLPISTHWKRRFPTPETVTEYLGLQAGGPTSLLLEQQNWSRAWLMPPYDVWLIWASRHGRSVSQESKCIYKLYLSPTFEFVRDVLQITVEALPFIQAAYLKVGKNMSGLLRPDKLLMYFWSFNALMEASDYLGPKLAGIPAHGVPFTAEIAGNGLLSWGVDPPIEHEVFSWQDPESWRQWVTNRLARAILMAKMAPACRIEPWRFALERLRVEGVDIEAWTPTHTMWYTEVEAQDGNHGPFGTSS